MVRKLRSREVEKYTSTLLEKIISEYRDPKILIVGPNEHPLDDPNTLCAANICAELGRGEVYVVDAQSKKVRKDGIYGNINDFEAQFNRLKEFGISLADTSFQLADALEMPWGKNTFDIIIDHLTLYWIVRDWIAPSENTDVAFKRAITEYLRVLKPNGTYLLLSRDDYGELKGLYRLREIKSLDNAFSEEGIIDKYLIRLPEHFKIDILGKRLYNRRTGAYYPLKENWWQTKSFLRLPSVYANFKYESLNSELPEVVSFNGKYWLLLIPIKKCDSAIQILKR